jgi:hypothetical protein
MRHPKKARQISTGDDRAKQNKTAPTEFRVRCIQPLCHLSKLLKALANRPVARRLKTPVATALLPNAFGCAFLYSLPKGIVNAGGRVLLHSRKHMAVKIERDADTRMAEPF